MKRAGFTMIELIFVIVILGILGAVAIPKLSAVKDDAQLASAAQMFCSDAIKSKLNTKHAFKHDINGTDISAYIDIPNDWSGSTVTSNDFNSTTAVAATLTNSTNKTYVYYFNGKGDYMPQCVVSHSSALAPSKGVEAYANGQSIVQE